MILLLAGCLDRLLESPYILASGLGEARSLALAREGDLVVAGAGGTARVAPEGLVTPLSAAPVDALAISPNHRFALGGGVVAHEGGAHPAPGAIDIEAGWTVDLWVLYPDHAETLDLALEPRLRVEGFTGARAINLGPEGEMLVTFPTEVRAIATDGASRTVASGLVDARVAATDIRDRIYVIQGDPPELFRVDGAAVTLIARFLDDPRDLLFGRGPSLAPSFAYIATGSGRVDYLPVPW